MSSIYNFSQAHSTVSTFWARISLSHIIGALTEQNVSKMRSEKRSPDSLFMLVLQAAPVMLVPQDILALLDNLTL